MRTLIQRSLAFATFGVAAVLCGPTLAQSDAAAGERTPEGLAAAAAQTQGVTGGADARATLEKELLRLMGESRQLYRAVLKYVELENEYKTAREEAKQ